MRGSIAAAKAARIAAEAAAIEDIGAAEGAILKAEREFCAVRAKADAAVRKARQLEASAQRAVARLNSLLDLLDWRHGRQGRNNPTIANQFAGAVYAAVHWELDVSELSPADRRAEAAARCHRLLPGVAAGELNRFGELTWVELRQSNYQAGQAVGLRLDEWEAMTSPEVRGKGGSRRRSFQLRPAFRADGTPMEEADFIAILAERKRMAQAARRRAAGSALIAERRAAETMKAEWVRAQAAHLGCSQRTVARMLADGRLVYPDPCHSRVRLQKEPLLYQHAGMTSTQVDEGGGSKPPARPADAKDPAGRFIASVMGMVGVLDAVAVSFKRTKPSVDCGRHPPALPSASSGEAAELAAYDAMRAGALRGEAGCDGQDMSRVTEVVTARKVNR